MGRISARHAAAPWSLLECFGPGSRPQAVRSKVSALVAGSQTKGLRLGITQDKDGVVGGGVSSLPRNLLEAGGIPAQVVELAGAPGSLVAAAPGLLRLSARHVGSH